VLTDAHIEQIMQLFDSKVDSEYLAISVDNSAIATNDYNLSVSAYVEAEDTRDVIDITLLNAELKVTVAKIDQLRSDINKIVAEIEA
jgi:type I restriction enzyme M protein